MSPLERHLNDRSSAGVAGRMSFLEATEILPRSVHDWLVRRVWSKQLRHIRSIAPGIQFELAGGNGLVKRRGDVVASGVSLSQLIGRIEQPVSIVATGPSARDYAFDQLKQRYVVAVNGAPTFLKEFGIVPDLWIVTDPDFAFSGGHHFENAGAVPLVTTCPAASVLAKVFPTGLTNRRFSIIERVNAWYGIRSLPLAALREMNEASGSPFHFPADESIASKVGWSHSPELGFFSGCNVVFAALQVVAGLGAKDIEIIGMDLSGQGRVYDEGAAPRPSQLQEQYQKFILPSFGVMRRALDGSDVKIRNLSPVCPLPKEYFS